MSGPPLSRLKITVGWGANDGTSDWVQVKFKNRDRQTCTTDYLNYNSYGFSFNTPGDTVTMDTDTNKHAVQALGDCLTVFRPDDELWVQIIMTRKGWNIHHDGYAFSRIEATFGKTVWSYQDNFHCDGCNEYWRKMKKQSSYI